MRTVADKLSLTIAFQKQVNPQFVSSDENLNKYYCLGDDGSWGDIVFLMDGNTLKADWNIKYKDKDNLGFLGPITDNFDGSFIFTVGAETWYGIILPQKAVALIRENVNRGPYFTVCIVQ